MKTQKATTAAKKETKSKNQATNKDAKLAKAERKHTAPKGARESNEARPGSKKEIVLKLLRRDQGPLRSWRKRPTGRTTASVASSARRSPRR